LGFAKSPTLVTPNLGVASATSLAASAAIKSSGATAGVGYTTGAGGTVTQATSKSTPVTLNTICGQITMNNSALAAGTTAGFTLNNSNLVATDCLILNFAGGGVESGYELDTGLITAGLADIYVRNRTGGSLSEAIVINFAIIKAVAA
jgi:hypothetical protein